MLSRITAKIYSAAGLILCFTALPLCTGTNISCAVNCKEGIRMTLRLDEKEHIAVTEKGAAELTPIEFGILSYLVNNGEKCSSAEEIYRNVWQTEPFACRSLIAVHIHHLRVKIEPDPANPVYIRGVWGKGYRYSG